jgi:hypothetical protein
MSAKKSHNLQPYGIADFAEAAVLQGACGSALQLYALRLDLGQSRQSLNLGYKPSQRYI